MFFTSKMNPCSMAISMANINNFIAFIVTVHIMICTIYIFIFS